MNANHMTIGFIGLGLIGGSIAKTIRRIHPDSIIYGFDTNTDSLKAAKEDGTLNQYFETLDSTFSSCDIIFLCAPVSNNIEYLKELKDIVSENCLLTDVGSVKEPIQTAIKELDMETNFIGGHPMVGSEKSGYAYANDHLLENAYYFLTPSERTLFQLTTKFSSFIQGLGALAVSLKPEEHDFITAGVSHLPHIIASTLVNLVRELDNDAEYMKTIAAGGFRDITRIASSSPVMWEQICLENHENISHVLDEYIKMLIQARCSVDNLEAETLYDMFANSRDYRDSIDTTSSGLINKTYVLYIDIVDEAGGIATIATILAMEGISIKNIGIIHNREFEQGVLKIEFYEEDAMKRGTALLKKRNYIVYER